MNPELFISNKAKEAVKALYGVEVDDKMIQTQTTRKEFEGDITLVAFPLLKTSRKSPEATATEIGGYIKENEPMVENFNVVKGFLNIKLSEEFWPRVVRQCFASARQFLNSSTIWSGLTIR